MVAVVLAETNSQRGRITMQGFWTIYKNGTAVQSGVDYGNGSKAIEVVSTRYEEGELVYFTVKVPGGKHWAGNYRPQASHPGRYLVFRVLEHTEMTPISFSVKAAEVDEFNLRAKRVQLLPRRLFLPEEKSGSESSGSSS
jgi:hypothetical protein